MELEFIKKTIEEILSKLSIEFELETSEDKDINAICFLIKTKDPRLLIGYKGANLLALNHIIKRIVDKKFNDEKKRVYFILDVNNYQKNKIEEIKSSANILAERARYFKSNVEMKPLPSSGRMVVHALFTNSNDFETESCGEGEKRRVVIKYIGE
jgi:predicted RNA-binding protein Jag